MFYLTDKKYTVLQFPNCVRQGIKEDGKRKQRQKERKEKRKAY